MPTTIGLEPDTKYKPFDSLSPEALIDELATAHYLSITPRLMTDLIQENRIVYHRIGWRTIRIKVADLREFLNRTRVPAKANVPVQSRISKKPAKQLEEVSA